MEGSRPVRAHDEPRECHQPIARPMDSWPQSTLKRAGRPNCSDRQIPERVKGRGRQVQTGSHGQQSQ